MQLLDRETSLRTHILCVYSGRMIHIHDARTFHSAHKIV